MILDDRKAAVLRAVVQEYIDTAQPVGSAHVARTAGIPVSPATVRSEMARLERDGYLTQPHTSAGRIPTDLGYRVFVDELAPAGSLAVAQRQQIREFFARAHGELEQMLHETGQLLSRVTDYAALVVPPSHDECRIRSVQLVDLGPRVVMVVAVLSDGAVEKGVLELDRDMAPDRVAAAGAHLAAHLIGTAVGDGGLDNVPSSGDAELDALSAAAGSALRRDHRDDADHVFVGGASRMAAAFDAVGTVRNVLSALEQQYVVVSLIRDMLDRGHSVSIGAEHGVQPLAECSIVVSPYEVEGELAGAIGVLGPTRMNYPQALAAVAVVSERLGRRLSEG
ncbi:MAG: heat-inducible transcriptional repressor HrcA [Acidimicrobiales bacterium]